jgi:hypothetical protein
VQIGDEETVARLSEIRKSIGNQQQQGPSKIAEVVGPDGRPAFAHVTPQGSQVIPGAGPLQSQGTQARARPMTLVNPETGKPEIAMMDGDGNFTFTGQVPGTSRDAAGTEGERKGAVLLTMVNAALPTLDAADAPSRLDQMFANRGVYEALPAEQQMNQQAGMLIADAYIRLTSGANAPEPEVQRTMRMIIPQPGDTRELIGRKRATRQAFVAALKVAAGRAGAQVPEEPVPGPWKKGYVFPGGGAGVSRPSLDSLYNSR